MRFLKKLGVAAFILVFIVGYLFGWPRSWSWHEKLTLEVQTPDGIKTASSVIRQSMSYTSGGRLTPPEAQGARLEFHGEAVVLELDKGRYLFAILKDMPNPFVVFFPGEAPIEVASELEDLRETRVLTPDQYPWLVTFDDINDPQSVRRVDPGRLDEYFGPGYALKSIKLAITGDPVTEGRVDAVLGWLPEYYDRSLDGREIITINAENRVANSLGPGNFDTERD